MKIEDLRLEKHDTRVTASASVTWEDSDRPKQELFFETDSNHADGFSCNPNAFLLACSIPALHFKERRIFMKDEVCSELVDGLNTSMHCLRHWYYEPDRQIVTVEARKQGKMHTSSIPKRAASFFSGGVDSSATLKMNRHKFPQSHPWYIKDGLIAYGLEIDRPEVFKYVVDSIEQFASAAGIDLIPVKTNIYLEYRSEDRENKFDFWKYKFQGAALAAIAHSFANRLGVLSIPGTDDLPNMRCYGSHPLLDPNFSSVDLRIRHDGLALSRLKKVEMIKNWDLALNHLRVCNNTGKYKPGKLNCGRCEKCIRTALELLVMNRLDRCATLPIDDVSAEMIKRSCSIRDGCMKSIYLDLIPFLNSLGRRDLVKAIEHQINKYHATHKNKALKQFKRNCQKKLISQFSPLYRRFVGNKPAFTQ